MLRVYPLIQQAWSVVILYLQDRMQLILMQEQLSALPDPLALLGRKVGREPLVLPVSKSVKSELINLVTLL